MAIKGERSGHWRSEGQRGGEDRGGCVTLSLKKSKSRVAITQLNKQMAAGRHGPIDGT